MMRAAIRGRNSHLPQNKNSKFRRVICAIIWFGLFALYTERLNLSVCIVGMIKNTKQRKTADDAVCPPQTGGNLYVEQQTTKYDWTSRMINHLLLAYNTGYLLNHVIGSLFARRYNCRIVMNIYIFGSALFTLLSVFCVENFALFFICRALVGICQGPLYPIAMQLMADYAPKEERTKIMLFTHSGNILSLIFTFSVGGGIIEIAPNGWKYVFYITSFMGFIEGILWFIFVYDIPEENPWLSKEEATFIVNSVYPKGRPPKQTIRQIPWKSIFTSVHLYIFLVAHFAKLMILYMNLFGLPLFFKDYFAMNPLKASLLSTIPFTVDFLAQLMYPKFMTYLKNKGFSTTNARRLSNLIGSIGCPIFLVPVGFLHCSQYILGVVFMCCSLAFIPCFQAGYYVASVEIAPQYSLIVGAIVNMGGSFAGIFQRYITGEFTTHYDYRIGYRYSFIVTAVLVLLGSLVYAAFGTADLQPWADPENSSKFKAPDVDVESDSSNEISV